MGTGDATLENVLPTNGLSDILNSALYLTGSPPGSFMKIPFHQLSKHFGNGSLTVTMFLLSESGEIGDIWNSAQSGKPMTGFLFRLFPTNGSLHIDNTEKNMQSPANTVQPNKWHYIAGVIDNSAKWTGIYRDEELAAEMTFTRPAVPTSGSVSIGSTGWRTRIFCVQLYNFALTKIQIEQSRDVCEQMVIGCRSFGVNGSIYNGTLAVTASDTPCQAWGIHKPHEHPFANKPSRFPEESVTKAKNYCRDPDGKRKPWCYTIDPKVVWEYCNVPVCTDSTDSQLLKDINNSVSEDKNRAKIGGKNCTNDTEIWTHVLVRVSNSVNFERKWNEYVKGFGDCSNFWIGLDELHKITNHKRSALRVEMWDWDNKFAYAEYNQFKVENASTNYRMTVGGYRGTAGNALSYHSGMKFSTIDRDTPTSCSQKFGGGWWYNNCVYAHPTGVFYNPPDAQNSPSSTGIVWFHWKNNYDYSLKKITLKVRALV